MTIMMMIMTDPFTTNLVVKGAVVKGSVVKGATSTMMMMLMMMIRNKYMTFLIYIIFQPSYLSQMLI